MKNFDRNSPILIAAEHDKETIEDITFELAGCALSLGGQTGQKGIAVFFGIDSRPAAQGFTEKTGIDVIIIDSPSCGYYSADAYSMAAAFAAKETGASVILAGNTPRGLDFGPAAAVHLSWNSITAAEKIEFKEDRFLITRTILHSKFRAVIDSGQGPAVITVQPGSWESPAKPVTSPGEIAILKTKIDAPWTLSVAVKETGIEETPLDRAHIIFAAGMGAREEGVMELIEELARKTPRSATAGTRAACDRGLVPYGKQVGMTGQKVAPRVYVACGISGSPQHIMGMEKSKGVIAVNRDKNAPIFRHADLGIVANLEDFLPELIIEAEKHYQQDS